MPNAKSVTTPSKHNILLVGPTGSGKTTQIRTLPGKKFAYLFDPNALQSLRGCDVDYEEFLPDTLEMDATIKGFNKGPMSDRPASRLEPTTYIKWVEDLNKKVEDEFFSDYDWLIIDSGTLLLKTMFDRNAYINNRYGKIEELSDYRVVGSKMGALFRPISSMSVNILLTGHVNEFQDEKSKKVTTELNMPGSARRDIPLVMTNIWLCRADSDEKKDKYMVQTRPGARGLQTIRSSIQGLEYEEDVTIKDFTKAEDYGIGRLLTNH